MCSSSSPADRLVAAAAKVARAIGDDDSLSVTAFDDDGLLALLTDASNARNAAELIVAAASAEIDRRSRRELGYEGLAQRRGHRNGTSLVQNITGQSRGDVTRAVQTGADMARPISSDQADARPPWLAALHDALSSGRLSSSQFRAIRAGLGEPPVDRYPHLEPEFLPAAWASAVSILLGESATLPVEELRAAARIARDRLDPVGVAMRFGERFAARSFRTWVGENGQHHARIVFDDEAAAWVHAILQAALRPRRGPRFVGTDASERRAEADADERSNEQLQYDTLVAVLRTGAAADPAQAFGDRQPGVRIIVESGAIVEEHEATGSGERRVLRVTGVGHLEDGGQTLPGGVVEKFLCDAGAVTVSVDAQGRPLDVGRGQRLFTRKQRIAIAARDGGCLWPACTAPPSQCEYHHNDHWWQDHGSTDVDDGVPLCRNCHLRLHNQRWRISRERDASSGVDTYWLHPPADPKTGARGEPVRLVSKSPRRFAAAS